MYVMILSSPNYFDPNIRTGQQTSTHQPLNQQREKEREMIKTECTLSVEQSRTSFNQNISHTYTSKNTHTHRPWASRLMEHLSHSVCYVGRNNIFWAHFYGWVYVTWLSCVWHSLGPSNILMYKHTHTLTLTHKSHTHSGASWRPSLLLKVEQESAKEREKDKWRVQMRICGSIKRNITD